MNPYIFVQSQENPNCFKPIVNNLEELEVYCSSLWPMGQEWHLLQYLKPKVLEPLKELARIQEIERLERLERERILAEQLEEEERKRLEMEEIKERRRLAMEERRRLFELNGPRKSERTKSNIKYVDNSSSDFEEESSSDEITDDGQDELTKRPRRASIVDLGSDEESISSSVTNDSLMDDLENPRAKRSKQEPVRASSRLRGKPLESIN